MEEKKTRILIFLTSIAVYILASSVAVLSAWRKGLMPVFEFGYTVSVYVGLQRQTAVFYFICMLIVALLLFILILKTGLRIVQKIAFSVSLLFLIGLSWFPVQFMDPENPATRGHAFFSNAFFISVIVTLILFLVFSKKKSVRIYAIAGVLYGLFFVVAYIFDPSFFRSYILIWETVFIYLYIFEYPVSFMI